MKIMHRLTLRYLLKNRRRTLITIIGIVLSVAMLTAVSGFVASFQDLMIQDIVNGRGDWQIQIFNLTPELSDKLETDPFFTSVEIKPQDNGALQLYAKAAMPYAKAAMPSRSIERDTLEVAKKYNIPIEDVNFNHQLLMAQGYLTNDTLNTLIGFASILAIIIIIGSVIVISNAFYISQAERSHQFGMLGSVGATKRQIRALVFYEAMVLAALAIPAGLLLGYTIEAVALMIANRLSTGMIDETFHAVVSPVAMLAAVVLSLLTVLLSAWIPARRAASISCIEAIRQTRDIKINPRKVKAGHLSGKLFGTEGMLASKFLARSRSKYRATVISLVVSQVLFIGVSTFGDMMSKSVSMLYTEYEFNVMVTLSGEKAELFDEIKSKIEKLGGYESAMTGKSVHYTAQLKPNYLTGDGKKIPTTDGVFNAALCSIGDSDFSALCAELGTDSSAFYNMESPQGILINTIGGYRLDNKRSEAAPFLINPGESISLIGETGEQQVTVAAQTWEVPQSLLPRFSGGELWLIVPDEVFSKLSTPESQRYSWLCVQASNAEEFSINSRELLVKELGSQFMVFDIDENVRMNRNTNNLVMLFVYGFVAMLSLIGVTNVIGTISTGMALRRREFAMLRSVGMDSKSLMHMLNFESLLYGVRSLLIGLPLGLAASYGMYLALGESFEFAYIWPVQGLVISVIAVFLLSFCTMRYSAGKLRQNDIIETLRADSV